MKGRQLEEYDSIDILRKKKVLFLNKEIDLSKAVNLGNKSLGRIDFLTKRKGYFLQHGRKEDKSI